MAGKLSKVVVIVPTYNECGNIELLVKTLFEKVFPKVASNYLMSILVVDDSSPDGTGAVVKSLAKKYPDLNLYINPHKAGLGNAYTKGMWHALNKLGAEIVFEFDADLQHDPEKIPLMLQRITDGADMVLGSRYIKGGGIPAKWGIDRKFFSIVGNWIIRLVITNFSIHDWTTGYRAIKAKVVKEVLPELDQERFMGYTFQIGFLHKAIRRGYRIDEVPFVFRDRKEGQSKLGREYVKNTLLYIFKVRAKEIYTNRIFRFVVVGLIGGLIQLTSLQVFRRFMPYQLATFFSIELAILSNFIWSNLWTFGDRKLSPKVLGVKFVQFNVTSAGSLLIQQVVAFIGENLVGLKYLFTTPILGIEVDTGLVFAVLGILLGMFWNFFAYSRIIWKKSK